MMKVAANQGQELTTRRASMIRTMTAVGLLTGMWGLAAPLLAFSPAGGRASDKSGRNAPGYLGISFRDVSDEQIVTLKLKDLRGVEVILIDHDGPAFHAGLREHDILLQISGQAIEGSEQLRRLLRDMPSGRSVAFTLSRDGQQQTLSAQLANRNTVGQEAWERHITVPEPASVEDQAPAGNHLFGGGTHFIPDTSTHGLATSPLLSASYTGAMLEVLNPQLADFFGAASGLLVREVDANSPAALAGLRAGDVVLKINAVAVLNPGDWLKTIYENRGRSVPVVVLRDRREQTLTLTPDGKRRSKIILLSPWPDATATLGMIQLPDFQ